MDQEHAAMQGANVHATKDLKEVQENAAAAIGITFITNRKPSTVASLDNR